jgi:hypothetical protein
MRIRAKPPVEVGTRMVLEEAGVEVRGGRLREPREDSVSDCVLVGPEGTGTVDVRVALRTDDGAAIFVRRLAGPSMAVMVALAGMCLPAVLAAAAP